MATDLFTAIASSRTRDASASMVPSSIEETIVEDGKSVAGAAAEHQRSAVAVRMSDFVQLTKPRIVVMILVTTVATAMIGAGGLVPAGQLMWLLIATAAVAGSAGAANQVWERAIDTRMSRTANRPVAAGRVGTIPATLYTLLLLGLGTGLMAALFSPVPAAVGVATWVAYVLIYTPMKTRTAWNTTVGAIAGALPMMIGYTAFGGSLSDAAGWLLVGVLAAWQYPHFMAIAWMYRRQYAEAGFCMTTTVEPTGRSAGWQSVLGSLALILCSVALCFLPGGWISGTIASVAAVGSATPMLLAAMGFVIEPSDRQARKLLRSSLLVLPAVLAICTLRLFW